MENIDMNMIKENSIVKFINGDKAFFDGYILRVDKNFLGIVISVNQSTYKEFKKNEYVQIIFICGKQAIKCVATIIGSKTQENQQSIIVDTPKIILAIERREFERIDIVMDIEYSQLPEGIEYEELNMVDSIYFRHYKKTYTIDISAGGVNIVIPINEKDTKFILAAFSINDKNIPVLCSRIRSESMNDGKHKKMAYQFVDIDKQHRQLILDYVSTKSKDK